MTTEITLRVDLPEIVETPIKIEVRCGDTCAYVYEHGSTGSGDWAAWSSPGHVIAGGTRGYTLNRAIVHARAFVRREERERRLRVELRKAMNDLEASS